MSRTAKNAVIIMVATLLSRVLGFLRETILANFYGTSMVADVFVLTFNIPGLIISIVGSVIYMMYIPMYYDTRDRLGEDEALKFTNNILNILSVFSIIVSILGIIFAGEIIKIFAIGFTGEKFNLAVQFLRIMMFGVLFLSLNKIQSSFLQVKESYLPASIVGVVYNIVIIIAIFISVK
ncbi:MAG: murein biosynthesis integral membrane protein MurJ [Intestinibacter sp.]